MLRIKCRIDIMKVAWSDKIQIELSRCATACQGCGAVFIFEKGSDKTLPKDYRLSATKNIILSTGVLLLLPYEKITIASSSKQDDL